MKGGQIHRRIFVVGTPRSGTTLVQSLLAAHSQASSFPESHFFSRHFSRPLRRLGIDSWQLLTQDPFPRLHEFLAESNVAPGLSARLEADLRRIVPSGLKRSLRTQATASGFLHLLDQVSLARGKPVWIEKTPMHLYSIPLIEQVSKTAAQTHFVHVIRSGIEVVSSLYKASQQWERRYDLDTCVARWNQDLRQSLRRIGSPNDHFVLYEDIATRPEEVMPQVFEALGLAWEPEILEHYAQEAGALKTAEETWKENNEGAIQRSATSKATLSTEQRAQVEAGLNQALYQQLCTASNRISPGA